MTPRLIAPAALLAAGLLVPAGAQAATKTVSAGIPVAKAQAMPHRVHRQRVLSQGGERERGRQGRVQDRRPPQRDLPGQGRRRRPRSTRRTRPRRSPASRTRPGADFWFNGQPNWKPRHGPARPGRRRRGRRQGARRLRRVRRPGRAARLRRLVPEEGDLHVPLLDPPGHEGQGQGPAEGGEGAVERPRTPRRSSGRSPRPAQARQEARGRRRPKGKVVARRQRQEGGRLLRVLAGRPLRQGRPDA